MLLVIILIALALAASLVALSLKANKVAEPERPSVRQPHTDWTDWTVLTGWNRLSPSERERLERYIHTVITTRNQKRGFSLYWKAKYIVERTGDKRLGLAHSIEAFKACPEYFPIKCLYPNLFGMVYHKRKYLALAIEQYERFLPDILSVRNGDDKYELLQYDVFYDPEKGKLITDLTTNRRPELYISEYLLSLCRDYTSSGQYERARGLLDALLDRNDSGIFVSIQSLFYAMNRLDEGIAYTNAARHRLQASGHFDARGLNNIDAKAEDSIRLMCHWKTLKRTKRQPRQEEPITEEVWTIGNSPGTLPLEHEGKVPVWKVGGTLAFATPQQKEFYEHWRTEFERGNYIDIEGNVDYVVAYLRCCTAHFVRDKDIRHLLDSFAKVRDGYATYDFITRYLARWTIGAYLHLALYDEAWRVLKETEQLLEMEDFTTLRNKCNDTSIDGYDLLRLLRAENGLTSFGQEHLAKVADLATGALQEFHTRYKKNLIQYYCDQFNFGDLKDDDYSYLKQLCQGEDERKFFFWKDETKRTMKHPRILRYDRCLSKCDWVSETGLVQIEDRNMTDLKCTEIPYIIDYAVKSKARQILRGCENIIRKENHLPRVGEGWISETLLYNQIKEAFPGIRVLHHARPRWLAPQHLDIYIPERNLAIEYQGRQHVQPIAFFGGEETFQKTLKRDSVKKQKCLEAGVELIEVFEEYDLPEVIAKLSSYINKLPGNNS
jgi:hypothetical protein